MAEFTIASINCRGLSELRKRRDVLHFLRNQSYDVLFSPGNTSYRKLYSVL